VSEATGTDIVPVVNPATGEALELSTEATDRLAHERRGVTDVKRALDQYATHIDEELTRRLDRMGRRSAVVNGWKIETKAPTSTDYSVPALRVVLHSLVHANVLDPAVVDEVLVPVDPCPVKLNRVRLNTLLKHPDDRVREALAACAVETEVRRSVSVKGPAAA
jgi:hypothetical protein